MCLLKFYLHQILQDKVHICKGYCFHEDILCADGKKIIVQSYPHKRCILTVYIHYEFNWNRLPQMSHLKGSFYMVYFCHELIHYAFWNYFLYQILKKKFKIVRDIAFMNIFFVLIERRCFFNKFTSLVSNHTLDILKICMIFCDMFFQ